MQMMGIPVPARRLADAHVLFIALLGSRRRTVPNDCLGLHCKNSGIEEHTFPCGAPGRRSSLGGRCGSRAPAAAAAAAARPHPRASLRPTPSALLASLQSDTKSFTPSQRVSKGGLRNIRSRCPASHSLCPFGLAAIDHKIIYPSINGEIGYVRGISQILCHMSGFRCLP